MAKVLQVDCTGWSDITKDLGSNYSEVWFQADVALNAAALTNLLTKSGPLDLIQLTAHTSGYGGAEWYVDTGPTAKWAAYNGTNDPASTPTASPTITSMQFYTIKIHLIAGSPLTHEGWIDGTSLAPISQTGPGSNLPDIRFLDLYNSGINAVGAKVFYDNVKVGSTEGATDIFSDDFEGGDLSHWTSAGPVYSVVDDPGIAPAVGGGGGGGGGGPEGICLAFTNGPLEDPVTWTRIDNINGVRVTEATIDRGRSDERSKTNVGTATIRGVDTLGVLDPTNTSGPYVGNLLPVKQAAITIFNPVTADWHYLFRGYVDSYSYTPDPSEKFTEFEITLVDMLDMLNDAEITPDQAGNTVPSESVGDCYYTGQTVQDRLLAVLADAAVDFPSGVFQPTWPSSRLQVASGNVYVQGRVYANRTSLLQVIDEACDAEFPGATNRFITKDGAFAFRGRFYRFVPDFYAAASDADRSPGTELVHWDVGDLPAYALDSTVAVYSGLKFDLNKTNLINAALVTPIGVTDAQLASGSNFYSDATSTSTYGPRTSGLSLENLINDGSDTESNNALQETATFAQATVLNYKDPVPFVSELTFRNPSKGDPVAASNTWAVLTGVELSDLVTVTATFPGGGGFNTTNGTEQDHFVESIKYQLGALRGDEWNVTLTVGLSTRHHFRQMPASWNPPDSPAPPTTPVLSAGFSP